ncbi:MAG: metallophosphoesterase [Thermoplasmatota archaeon]
MRPVPVFGERALLVHDGPPGTPREAEPATGSDADALPRPMGSGPSLVVGDLHIGLESELRDGGVHLPSQTRRMRSRLETLVRETGARRVIVLGDLKHRITMMGFQEAREVPEFFAGFPVPVELVRGNHDADLDVPRGLTLHTALGMLADDVGLCHGHVWPASRVMSASTIVTCHNHPMVLLVDEKGARHKEPCWVRAPFLSSVRERYPSLPAEAELVVLPAFNDLLGGIAFNAIQAGETMGPLWTVADLEAARLYTLDGVALGTVADLRQFAPMRPRRSRRRTLLERD